MADKKDAKSPATTSLAYDTMLPKWQKVQTLLDGTDSMRAAGEVYLPRHDNEVEDAYLDRLNCNVLRNITAQTLDSWVGRPFGEPLTVNENVPDVMIPQLEDIDREGNDVQVFARNWFREGLAKGVAPIMIDYPRTAMPVGQVRTQEDDIREGVRPYWVKLTPENVIAAYGYVINGVDTLVHLRVKEQVTVQEGFAERTVDQVRVYDLIPVPERADDPTSPMVMRMRVQIWQEIKKEKSGKKVWMPIDEWVTGISRIPCIMFYASERKAIMVAKPVIEDLADLNIRHWQSNSDQIAILTVTRFPILALSGGAPEDDELTIGPKQWLYCADARGKFYYVEHTGSAIKTGADYDADLIEQMADYGAEFLKRRPTNTPATSRILDSDEATSPLQDATIRFNDALNLALQFHAEWMRLPSGGTITINTEFGPSGEQSVAIGALQTMRKERDISRDVYLRRMKDLGVLPDAFDFEENEKELEEEALEAAARGEPTKPIDEGAPPASAEDKKPSGD